MKEIELNHVTDMDSVESEVASLPNTDEDVPEAESIASGTSSECIVETAKLIDDPADGGSIKSAAWSEKSSSTELVLSLEWPNTVNDLKHFKLVPMDQLSFNVFEGIKPGSLFDSHCHLDRIFTRKFDQSSNDFYGVNAKLPIQHALRPLAMLKKKYKFAFGRDPDVFEGCIHNICHPKYFSKRYWEWMTQERGLYLALGCHPQSAKTYDEVDDYELATAMKHPKVVAVGECGLDDLWANDDDNIYIM